MHAWIWRESARMNDQRIKTPPVHTYTHIHIALSLWIALFLRYHRRQRHKGRMKTYFASFASSSSTWGGDVGVYVRVDGCWYAFVCRSVRLCMNDMCRCMCALHMIVYTSVSIHYFPPHCKHTTALLNDVVAADDTEAEDTEAGGQQHPQSQPAPPTLVEATLANQLMYPTILCLAIALLLLLVGVVVKAPEERVAVSILMSAVLRCGFLRVCQVEKEAW